MNCKGENLRDVLLHNMLNNRRIMNNWDEICQTIDVVLDKHLCGDAARNLLSRLVFISIQTQKMKKGLKFEHRFGELNRMS